MLLSLLLALAALQDAPAAGAAAPWTWETLELADGARLDCAVQRPASGLPDGPVPLLLALPPGEQDRAMVERGLALYWSAPALERGWVVVSPAAPAGGGFRDEGVAVLEALLDELPRRFVIEGDRPHLAGVSSGGRAAFDLALRAPDSIGSLTGAPGMPDPRAEPARVARLAELPVALFVGGDDAPWRDPMRRVRDTLRDAGALRLSLIEFPGEGHVPASLDGERLFQQLDAFHAWLRRRAADERAARTTLDDFHRAAAEGDLERYFELFAPEGVFVGTDPDERWDVQEFRAYAAPHFADGEGWLYVPMQRELRLGPRGELAWFHEQLDSPKYGTLRGSGVLRRVGEHWRVAQYVLSFPVPNEFGRIFFEVVHGEER